MNDANTGIEPRLAVIGGQVTATSLMVTEHFDKRHADILRAIKHLECSEEFRQRNFALVNETISYVNSDGELVEKETSRIGHYQMTKDGFMFLVLAFTGKKAARIREAYINAFNAMEHELIQLRLKAQTDAARRDIEKELRDAFAHSDADWIVKLRSADKNTLPPLVFITVCHLCGWRAPAIHLLWHLTNVQLGRGSAAWYERSARALSEETGGMFSPAQINRAISYLVGLNFVAVGRTGGAPRSFKVSLDHLKRQIAEATSEGSEHLVRLPVLARERLPRSFDSWLSVMSGGTQFLISSGASPLFGAQNKSPHTLAPPPKFNQKPIGIDPANWGHERKQK